MSAPADHRGVEPPCEPAVAAPRAHRRHGFAIGLTIVFLGFFVLMAGIPVAAITWFVHPVIVAVLGMALFMAGGVVAGVSGGPDDEEAEPAAPGAPSPSPAQAHGPGLTECPSCGAPPRVIDDRGIATCEYCETRYVVR